MKLSPEHNECLDVLAQRLALDDFDGASEVVERLGSCAAPALVPHLLSPFVPRALRNSQHERSWVMRTLRSVQHLAGSNEESAFRTRLGTLIARCVRMANADDLASIDETSRQCSSPRWAATHWRWLEVRELESCLPSEAELRVPLLGLASFHASGHVRELALTQLMAVRSGEELPFLLMRLNDWVDPVQRKAFRGVQDRINSEYAVHFARWLTLLERLKLARRNQLTDILNWALSLLVTPAALPALEAQYEARDRPTRRAALRLAVERLSGDERWKAVDRGLRDEDVGIRLWAARHACEAGRNLDDMECDAFGAIRVWAIRARVERDGRGALPRLHAGLFDRSASVRSTARFHLSRFEPDLVIADVYRVALDDPDAKTVECAISGLADLGDRDDAALISFHISSQSGRVAAAAVRACGRLARVDCRRELEAALCDERPSVSKAVRVALAAVPPPAAKLRALVGSAEHGHTRRNAIALAHRLDRWERLIILLDGAANERPDVRAAALVELERWAPRFEHNRYRAPLPKDAQRAEVIGLLANIAGTEVHARIERELR